MRRRIPLPPRLAGIVPVAETWNTLALPPHLLEALAEALLDFSGPADLAAWLAEHSG